MWHSSGVVEKCSFCEISGSKQYNISSFGKVEREKVLLLEKHSCGHIIGFDDWSSEVKTALNLKTIAIYPTSVTGLEARN